MASTVGAFLAQSAAQVGYREGLNNDTKFGRWYRMNNEPWCDMSVSYNAAAVGASDIVGRFAYCPAHVNWFKARGQWSTVPRPGAVVFYDWNGDGLADHVGVVESVISGGIVTLEGNTTADNVGSQSNGNGFYRRHRSTRYVLGYGHPAFAAAGSRAAVKVAAAPVTASKPRTATVAKGSTLGAAAVVLGVSVASLAGWNHIADPNTVRAGTVVTAPPRGYVAPAVKRPAVAPVAPVSAAVLRARAAARAATLKDAHTRASKAAAARQAATAGAARAKALSAAQARARLNAHTVSRAALKPGATNPSVHALESALNGYGYLRMQYVNSYYGTATSYGVYRLYQHLNWAPAYIPGPALSRYLGLKFTP